jgi:hypothetical protein
LDTTLASFGYHTGIRVRDQQNVAVPGFAPLGDRSAGPVLTKQETRMNYRSGGIGIVGVIVIVVVVLWLVGRL